MDKLASKTILVTGGTGSFGNKILRHLLETTDAKEFQRSSLKVPVK